MLWYVNYPPSETFFTPMHNVDFSYPAHLHDCLEITFCTAGAVEITVSGRSHLLTAGTGIVIPPNAVHSYHTPDSSEFYTILFSRSLLPDFAALFTRKVPKRYTFLTDDRLGRQLLEFYSSERTLFGGKSLLYRAAEAFLWENTFLDTQGDEDLTLRIVSYIQENLCSEITLLHLADHLGYSYFYISRQIRQAFGVPFTTLLAQYRIAYVKLLLDQGNTTISQAALSSGFGSIRTFNRLFQQITGMTPSQYLTGTSRREVLSIKAEQKNTGR